MKGDEPSKVATIFAFRNVYYDPNTYQYVTGLGFCFAPTIDTSVGEVLDFSYYKTPTLASDNTTVECDFPTEYHPVIINLSAAILLRDAQSDDPAAAARFNESYLMALKLAGITILDEFRQQERARGE